MLIFDEIGANWLPHAVPPSASIGYLSTRFTYPIFISRKFWMRLVIAILSRLVRGRREFYSSYLGALIDEIKPIAITTAADNTTALAAYTLDHNHLFSA